MKKYSVRLLKCAFVEQLERNHGRKQKKIRVKKVTEEIRGKQVKQTNLQDVSGRISLSAHIPHNKLTRHCPGMGQNKPGEIPHSQKMCYWDTKASEHVTAPAERNTTTCVPIC